MTQAANPLRPGIAAGTASGTRAATSASSCALPSIIERQQGEFHVRSRERRDLENLVARVPLTGVELIETPTADYACCLVTDRATVLAFLGTTLDYPNFEDQIHATFDQSHRPYHGVWQVLADALGAYGQTQEAR
jgi:hypothetical protein